MKQIVTPLVMACCDQYFLPYVLESVAGVFERMVLYDIGSTDDTAKIIKWFVDKEKDTCDFFVRYLPMCEPSVQGALRNSMISEARTDTYWLLDADEILKPEEAARVPFLANRLRSRNLGNPRTRFGVVRRIEVSEDLKQRYSEERSHHRLYTRDAIWEGSHPGETPFYAQNYKTEMDMQQEVAVLHMHNTLRSPNERDALKRLKRKSQKSYISGNLINFDILNEYPILRKPIEDWPVSPALKELQDA